MGAQIFHGIDEVAAAVGEHLGYSGWLEVTQERVDAFADATDDRQWIHVDPERAAATDFGGTIAHGYLTLSLLPALGAEIFDIDGVRMKINYGTNKIRFLAPVPVGSRIRCGARIQALERTPKGANLVTAYVIEIEGGERPALVAETIRVLVG
ncbi:MaoC family dehydratase [Nocardia vermiculata]|uniref:MaoC family dehydratase n=1 Tax=Nocardia vermiculata TaxID=257274 RepID=A0A846Y0Q2_9NOCA|nr:MaoC family dehydratase [Nocardia vermiculata]NKY51652.1 MaoC family dehydratase [Nocardia vermiculata]